MGNKELREAIDDDILAAQERIRLQTYKDGLDGQPQARQDFFKMVNGYFEKRETAASQKDSGPKTSIVLHVDPKPTSYKMLSAGGEVVDIDVSELKGAGLGGGPSPSRPSSASSSDDDEDEFEEDEEFEDENDDDDDEER